MISTIGRVSFLGVVCVTFAAVGCGGSGDPNNGSSSSMEAAAPFGCFRGEHRPDADLSRSVLIVGIAPEAVDLTDPSLPPGLTAEMIRQGLVNAQAQIAAAGDHADLCMILPDDTAEATVHACFATHPMYDAVVVGAGIRLPTKNLILFENVVNAIHGDARCAAIGFNANPVDSAVAAERVLAKFK